MSSTTTTTDKPTEPEALKKFLAKQLNDWKTNFKATHDGQGPTQSNIDEDPEIKAIFDEFSQLKKGTHPLLQQQQEQNENDSSAAAAAPEAESAAQQQEQNEEKPTEPEALKKFLAKQLNDWKSNFKATHDGHGPGQSDIEADPVIKAVFDEFTQLKKGTHPLLQQQEEKKPEEEAPAAAPSTKNEQQQDEQKPTDPEGLKKFLAKKLNDWKTNFKATHDGQGPTQSNIDEDPEIKAVFDEFTQLKKGSHPLLQQQEATAESAQQPPPQEEEKKPEEESKQPPAAPEAEPASQQQQQNEEKPTEPEALKKFLAKQLNDWKSNFKATHDGHGPGQSDIEADPVIKSVFDEFTQLKKGTHPLLQNQEQTPANEEPTTTAQPEVPPPPPPQPEQETPATATSEPEQQQQQQQPEERPATAGEAEKLQREEHQAPPEDDQQNKARGPTVASVPITIAYDESEKPTDDPEALKKFCTRLLNEWKTAFKEANDGKGPTPTDMETDPAIQEIYQEFAQLKKGTHPLQIQQQEKEAAAAAAKEAEEEAKRKQQEKEEQEQQKEKETPAATVSSSSTSDPEARKKELTKLLAEWKSNFKASHNGKGPTQSDIDADPEMKALYDEYSILKKGGTSSTAAKTTEEKEDDESKSATTAENQNKEESSSSSSPEERKKTLTKILAEWKADFKTKNGRGPKQSDIDQDEYISKIYNEYTELKKGNSTTAAASSDETPQKLKEEQEVDENKQQHQGEETADEMKKRITKILGEWKSNFKDANGRNPKQSDIEQDFETNIIYQQYNLLKNGGSVEEANAIRNNAEQKQQQQEQNQEEENQEVQQQQQEQEQSSDPSEDRKKQLAKILADWKTNFRSIHNKNPSQNDVMNDPEIREVYEEYSCLKRGVQYIPPPPPPAKEDTNNNKNANDDGYYGDNNNNENQIGQPGEYNDDQQQQQPEYDPNFNVQQQQGEYSYQGNIDMNNIENPVRIEEGGGDDNDNNNANTNNNEQEALLDNTTSGESNASGGGGVNFLQWLGGEDSESASNRRMDAVTHEHHVKMWNAATARQRIFTILEPSSTLVQPFPRFQRATGLYHLLYLIFVLSYIAVSLAETVIDGGVNDLTRYICIGIPNMWFTFDFVIRAATCTEWQYVPMIVIDLLSLATCWYALSDRAVFDGGMDIIRIFPTLRILRLMLFSRLFVRKEFFRDIEVALLTVQASLTPLFLFAILAFVFILLFSTFIFLTERGDWNESLLVWERPCREFVSPETCVNKEKSPFQSIPDGLWLTIQVMTTSGFGDTIPTSFWGRVVAGIAMIVGVFAIAFPTMLFIGNLEQVRKDYYAQLEKERIERSYRLDMIKILQDQQAAAERANMAKADVTMDLGATMNAAMNATMNATMNFASFGFKVKRDSNMVLFDETVNDEIPAHPLEGPTVATFSFMGNVARPIKKTRRGEFVYEPVMEFLCDPQDGAPVLSSVVEIDLGVFMAQMTLIVDDLVAQELAAEALFEQMNEDDAPTNGALPRATGVYNLDVSLSSPLENITVVRRIDSTKILENAVPVTIEINGADLNDVFDAQSAKEYARANLAGNNATFTISYSRAPVASAIWQKSVPITSIMLSTAPFIHDLLEIARYASVADLIENSDKRKATNSAAKKRRHIAFVSVHDIPELVFPVFRKVVGQSRYVIRNAAHFVEALTEMVVLHCRRVRHHEIPEDLRDCVYNGKTLSLSEDLMEVDLDYFRTVDWPLGTVVVEFAEMRGKITCSVPVLGGMDHEQPIIADSNAYERVNVMEKDPLNRLSTVVHASRQDYEFGGGGGLGGGGNGNFFSHIGAGGPLDDDDEGQSLANQNQHASFKKSNLFAQGVSNQAKLASLLAPPAEFH